MKSHLNTLRILHFVLAGLDLVWLFVYVVRAALVAAAAGAGSTGALGGSIGSGSSLTTDQTIEVVTSAGMCLVLLAMMALNIFAGISIGSGRRHGLCIATAVFNLIPAFSCCFVAGVPMGVYELVVLMAPDVKEVFKNIAQGMSFAQAMGPGRHDPDDPRGGKYSDQDEDEMDAGTGWDEGGKGKPRR